MKKAIIVGAGPVGLTMSHFLNKIDISNVVLEQHPELSVHPSAHFLHPRSMEIFRDIDLHE